MKNISENSDYNEKLNSAEDVFLLCDRIVIRLISLYIFDTACFGQWENPSSGLVSLNESYERRQ